ncbi:TPA: putative phage tail protein [Escherichia coli]
MAGTAGRSGRRPKPTARKALAGNPGKRALNKDEPVFTPIKGVEPGTQTLRQRQQRLDAKVNLAGGINENFYLAQLAALGRPDANITRYDKSTFTCSSACTDAVNAPEWRYYWQVNMPAATNTTWMTCGDPCDSALRIWGDTVVECVLNKLCPSHTYVIFKYPE